jgi:hypothetical protein
MILIFVWLFCSNAEMMALRELLDAISNNTAHFMNQDVASVFRHMGHIGEVQMQVNDYVHAATLPGVKTICEVGFNAGHSSATFLHANNDAKVIVFDLGNLPWTNVQVEYVKKLFPGRLTLTTGNSHIKIREYWHANPHVKCDLWSIDGDHGPDSIIDFEAARLMASLGGFVLADDHTQNFPAIKSTWAQLQREGKLQPVYCHQAPGLYQGYEKAWCLGRWLPAKNSANVTQAVVVPTSSPKQSLCCKYLVYTVVSAARYFNEAARLMIRTLRASLRRQPVVCDLDILIITDHENAVVFRDLNVLVMTVDFTSYHDRASMLKLRIFEFHDIQRYQSVLFVDCDILFNILDVDLLMKLPLKDVTKLHVYAEPNANFKHLYWSLPNDPFTEEELNSFRRDHIVPFNAGTFLFAPTQALRDEFAQLNAMIANYSGPFFFEQSFVNYWFTRRSLVSYSITDSHVRIFPDTNVEYRSLVHFTGAGDTFKVARMKQYAARFMGWMDSL